VISSTLSAIQLEEMARAAIAEANYKSSLDAKMGSSHVLEGGNLDLSYISNSHRGFVVGNKRGTLEKRKGANLAGNLNVLLSNESPLLEYQEHGEAFQG